MGGERNIKDEFNSEDISKLIAGEASETGHGTITLTTSWQSVLSGAPEEDYVLVLVKETVSGVVYFSYDNTGSPTDGPKLYSNVLALIVPGGRQIYLGGSNAGDTIKYTYRTTT